MFQAKFKVPNYYKDFHCKGNACRSCCCQGWMVTLTQDEYFMLMDEDCSKKLKDKIEAYVGILPHPTKEAYARINYDYTGQCPLRLENGYCGLQVECGEDKIASVCRYYPRAPHLYPYPECSVSNSCEAVLEALVKEDYSFSFEEKELSFLFSNDESNHYPSDFVEVSDKCLSILKDGEGDVLSRLNRICVELGMTSLAVDNDLIEDVKRTYRKSISIQDYLASIPSVHPSINDIYDSLLKKYPRLDQYLTNIIVNHFLYVRFPYASEKYTYLENAIALCYVVYLWLLLLFYNLKSDTIDEFVDITGNYFRVAEHSNLYDVILFYFKKRQKK